MKTASLWAALAAVAIVAGGISLVPPSPGVYAHAPARAHVVLGPVSAAAEAAPGARSTDTLASALIADARARYGRVDAVIHAASDGAESRVTGVAVTWANGG
jgi:hypothetical protein